MNKDYIIEKIEKNDFTPEKLLGWVKALPGAKNKLKPVTNKVGDMYMHNVFQHPYILLEQKPDGYWICGLLTSEETCNEILYKTESRFLHESYFTRALFTVTEPTGTFYGVYDNEKHLKKVLSDLKKIIS
jgi:hypothetical protein